MASIVERKRKDGTVSYLVQIIKRHPKHQESKTFDNRRTAAAWAKKREAEIDLALSEGRPITTQKAQAKTLTNAIDRYLAETRKTPGKTKKQVLETIKRDYDIAKKRCDLIRAEDIKALAAALLDGGRSPSTVGNYLSHLSMIFELAKPSWGYPLDKKAFDDGMIVCRNLGLTGKSQKRDRRPSVDEMNKLMDYFADKKKRVPQSAPMHKIIAFAMFSTRRQEEISRITWADLDKENKRILVRDMKDPTTKKGNHVYVELPDPCMKIIESMPKKNERIFPYGTDAISASFTRACKFLEIEDLHFHDLRHEGASRLFEMGRTIPQVASVSGHRSWQSLQRYTHIIASGDRWDNWKWINKMG